MESSRKETTKPSLQKEANEEFKMGYFNKAIALYTNILEDIDPNDKDILANRSLAYLKAGLYKLALLDSEVVLQIDPSHQKAIVRKIKSLWGLRRYEEAINMIETKLTKAQRELPFYKDLEVKSRTFLKQSKGEYDMCEIIKLPRDEFHEIGEYTGPIEVINIPGKGRGVIATADLSPGQLVMVSKAFAAALGPETIDARSQTLVGKLLGKLIHEDEDVRKDFGNLSACAGPNASPPTWIWSNITSDSEEYHLMMHEVNMRLKDNMFVNYRTTPMSCGIWTSASYFNNDCIDANIHIQYFGDIMIIRALNQIPKGQELTTNKFHPEEYNYRKQFMTDGKFECKCRLCIFEAQESEKTKNEVKTALASLKREIESINQEQPIVEQNHLDVVAAFGNLVLPSGESRSALHGRNNWSTARTTKAKLRKALKYFNRIAHLRAEQPSLNVAMLNSVVFDFAYLLFRNKLFGECVHVLQAARPTQNSAEGLIADILDSDQLIISCYLKLGDYNKIMEWIGILKSDLIRAYGTVEILREIGKSFLTQFDNLEIGLDFFSL